MTTDYTDSCDKKMENGPAPKNTCNCVPEAKKISSKIFEIGPPGRAIKHEICFELIGFNIFQASI